MIYIYKSSNLAQFLFIKINANLELFILGSKLAQFFLIKINANCPTSHFLFYGFSIGTSSN